MTFNPHVPQSNFLDLLLDAVFVVDRNGRFAFVSAASERIFGYTPEEMVGHEPIDFVHPDDRGRTQQTIDEILDGELKPYFENRYVRKDGKVVHIMWSARWSETEQVRVAVARDVTEQRRAESMQAALYAISEAANATDDLQGLFQRIHEIVNGLLPASHFYVTLLDEKNETINYPYHAKPHGHPPMTHALTSSALTAEVIRTRRAVLLTPDSDDWLRESLGDLLGQGAPNNWLGVPLESVGGIKGALVVQSDSGDSIYSERDKELLQFVAIQVAAAVERKRTHARLQYLAQHDQLTELPNRALFQDRLQTALIKARRDHTRLAVLYLDLDKFKQINDTFGHTTGDQLLRSVAQRLTLSIRQSDTPGRLGGDEFVVLLNGIEQPSDAQLVAGKITAALSVPYKLNDQTLQVIPSIGIALYPDDGEDEGQLIRYADDAMYRVKNTKPD